VRHTGRSDQLYVSRMLLNRDEVAEIWRFVGYEDFVSE